MMEGGSSDGTGTEFSVNSDKEPVLKVDDGNETKASEAAGGDTGSPNTTFNIVMQYTGGYTLRWIIICILMLTFGVGTLVYTIVISVEYGGSSLTHSYCTTVDCYESAYSAVRHMNQSIDPCMDFHEYACGAFNHEEFLGVKEAEETIRGLMYQANEQKLHSAIQENPGPERDVPWAYERKIQQVYKACLNSYERSNAYKYSNPVLMDIETNLGGWYVTNPNIDSYSFSNAIAHLAIDDNTPVLFRHGLAPVDRTYSKYDITIEVDRLIMDYTVFNSNDGTTEYLRTAYEDMVRATGAQMLQDSSLTTEEKEVAAPRVEDFVSDVKYMDKLIATSMAKWPQETGAYQYYWRATIGYMDSVISNIPFTTIFRGIYGDTLSSSTYTSVYCLNILSDIDSSINSMNAVTKKRMLNNYMVWRLTYAWLPDMSYDYNHIFRRWVATKNGVTTFSPDWYICFDRVRYYMSDGLSGLFIKKHFETSDSEKVKEMAKDMKESILEDLKDLDWMDDTTRRDAMIKVEAVITKVGHPKFMDTEVLLQSTLDKYYQNVTTNVTNHHGNIKSLMKNQLGEMSVIFWSGYDIEAHWRGVPTFSTSSTYHFIWNDMVVPAGVLQMPLFSTFDPQMPHFSYYAATGTSLANLFLYAINEQGRQYYSNGSFISGGSWYTGYSDQNYQSLKTCYADYNRGLSWTYSDVELANPITVGFPNPDGYAYMAATKVGSIRNSLNAYKKWVDKNGQEQLLAGVADSVEKSWFIAYAQGYCKRRQQLYEYSRVVNQNFIPENIRINSELAQIPEFRSAFSCESGKPMAPANQCKPIF